MNELEREFAGRLEVIHINAERPVGRILGERMGVHAAPTLLLVDGSGQEIWRQMGAVNRAEVHRQIAALD